MFIVRPSHPLNATRDPRSRAFSLIELLCVIAAVFILSTAAIPMVAHFSQPNMSSVAAQLQGTLEGARQFALANRTYVRVGLAEIEVPGGTDVSVQCMHSTDGSLNHAASGDFANADYWRRTDNPLVLRGVKLDQTLVGKLPGGSSVYAFGQDKGPDSFATFQGQNGEITYANVIQFDPLGQISIAASSPVRSAVIGLSNPRQPQDPAGFILCGYSGAIQGFRQEDLKN